MPQYIQILLQHWSSNTYLNNDDNEPMMMKDKPDTLTAPETIVHYILMKEGESLPLLHHQLPIPPSILELK